MTRTDILNFISQSRNGFRRKTYVEIARSLNQRKIETPSGEGQWTSESVRNLYSRAIEKGAVK